MIEYYEIFLRLGGEFKVESKGCNYKKEGDWIVFRRNRKVIARFIARHVLAILEDGSKAFPG